jgi:hypothetical protein
MMASEGGSDGRTDPTKSAAGQPGESDRGGYERDLGVVEAIIIVTRSCPSGVVISAANRALEAIKVGGADVMKQQAYFVLTAMKGWRGDRARQVHRSLTRYLETGTENEKAPNPTRDASPQATPDGSSNPSRHPSANPSPNPSPNPPAHTKSHPSSKAEK